ncbi:MAG TPA: hypothetical protein PLH57_04350 [Oligoflexia bacterium]|nr:hypothetical protein [Oligoflexia bacterium]
MGLRFTWVVTTLSLSLLSFAFGSEGFVELDSKFLHVNPRVIRAKQDRPHAVWAKMHTRDIKRVSAILKQALADQKDISVEIESFYRETGEVRLIIRNQSRESKESATLRIEEALKKNKNISLVGRRRIFRITEMRNEEHRKNSSKVAE